MTQVAFDEALVGARFDVEITAAHRWHVDGVVKRVTLAADVSKRPALRRALARLRRGGDGFEARKRAAAPRRFLAAWHCLAPLVLGVGVFYLWR